MCLHIILERQRRSARGNASDCSYFSNLSSELLIISCSRKIFSDSGKMVVNVSTCTADMWLTVYIKNGRGQATLRTEGDNSHGPPHKHAAVSALLRNSHVIVSYTVQKTCMTHTLSHKVSHSFDKIRPMQRWQQIVNCSCVSLRTAGATSSQRSSQLPMTLRRYAILTSMVPVRLWSPRVSPRRKHNVSWGFH